MSDNGIPSSAGDQQAYPAGPQPTQAYPAGPQPTQAYPGAAPVYPPAPPTYSPPPAAGMQQSEAYPAYTPAYPAYAPGYPAPRPASGLAITSLICGIAGVVFGSFLFFIVLPVIASVVAVITGHLALRKTKADPTVGGRGMAIAGLITGYVMIAYSLAMFAIIVFGFLFVGAFSLPFVLSA